jgi:hypothetical protein
MQAVALGAAAQTDIEIARAKMRARTDEWARSAKAEATWHVACHASHGWLSRVALHRTQAWTWSAEAEATAEADFGAAALAADRLKVPARATQHATRHMVCDQPCGMQHVNVKRVT